MQELVSICVVTYNNEKYIVETLESIKNQTYREVELIVSDDNSSDNTVAKVSKWIESNKERFVNVELILSNKNTGVTGNCNRALKASSGNFVKIIGDDLLKQDYLEKCINFFNSNLKSEVLCTEMEYFYPEEKFDFVQKPIDFNFFNLSAQEQRNYVRYKGIPQYPTPSIIYRKSVFDKVGFFDESIPMWEDGPMYFKLAKNKIKVYMLNEKLVDYRLLRRSLSNKADKIMKKNIALYNLKYVCPMQFSLNPLKSFLRSIKYFLITKGVL